MCIIIAGIYFLYIGRLSSEKGIDLLLDVFRGKKSNLLIGGDGPLKEMVLKASGENENIRYLGLLDKEAVKEKLAQCSVLIFPSIWYEGMPLILIEAFASGTPVIASNLGAMSSMIKDGYNGIHFTAGYNKELSEKTELWENMSINDKQIFYRNARKEYENFYTPEINRDLALEIYQSVIKNKAGE